MPPDIPTTTPNTFEVRNRHDGQEIEVRVIGVVTAAQLGDVEQRLIRLITVRQPGRLALTIVSTSMKISTDQLRQAKRALADFGGVLVIAWEGDLAAVAKPTGADGSVSPVDSAQGRATGASAAP